MSPAALATLAWCQGIPAPNLVEEPDSRLWPVNLSRLVARCLLHINSSSSSPSSFIQSNTRAFRINSVSCTASLSVRPRSFSLVQLPLSLSDATTQTAGPFRFTISDPSSSPERIDFSDNSPHPRDNDVPILPDVDVMSLQLLHLDLRITLPTV